MGKAGGGSGKGGEGGRRRALYEKLRCRARMPERKGLTTMSSVSSLGGAFTLLGGGPATSLSMPRPRLERCVRSLRLRSSLCLFV